MKNDMRAIARVRCYQAGALLRVYDFPVPRSQNDAVVALPSRAALVAEAQSNLVCERLAFPPYDGVTFDVEYENR